MMRLSMLAVLTLAACTAQTQDELARDAAKSAIRPVLQKRLPGVPVEPATDCIIDNASASEILTLAADAVTGPTASTVEIVGNIARRPGTIECFINDGLPVLLNRF